MINLFLKDNRIYFDRSSQFFPAIDEALEGVFGTEKRFLLGEVLNYSSIYFFLTLLSSFLDSVPSILPNVSYMPPISYIFLVI